MKILFIAPGGSIHTLRWIERVQKSGSEVLLYAQDGIAPRADYQVYSKKLAITKSGIHSIFSLVSEILLIRKIIQREKPDIVHLHWMFSSSAFATSFLRKQTIIATPWGSDILPTNEKMIWTFKQRFIYQLSLKRLVRNVDYFTCDAEHLKTRLVALGADKNRIEIIYFGTDNLKFNPANRSVGMRENWKLKEGDLAILSNRNFYPVYDIHTLIRAFSVLHQKYKNLFLVLGGSGPELDSLKETIAAKSLNDVVIFLQRLEDKDFATSVASADIYVSTSTSDGGLASSVAEAMASGVPVVITDFGENSKWLDKGSHGFSFAVGDSHDLSKKIEILINDPNLRNQMGSSARDKIIRDLNPLVESGKLMEFYLNAYSNN